MPVRIEVDATEVRRDVFLLASLTVQDILGAARPKVFKRLNTAKNAIRQNLSGQVLNRRSGQLANSADIEAPQIQGQELSGRVGILRGPATKYADIFLRRSVTDRTIRPRNAQKLAIPLPAAQTAGGVARYASPLRETLKAAFPDGTFVAKDIIFGKIGQAEIIPLFVLKDSVVMPFRDYMSGPITQLMQGVSEDVLQSATVEIRKALA